MFPINGQKGLREGKEENLGIKMLGNRILADQTLPEYLIEFLLVFSSAKNIDGKGTLRFHNQQEILEGRLPYYVNLSFKQVCTINRLDWSLTVEIP